MDHGNTIAAISTPYGKSAIGVIRVSGDNVCEIIETFIKKDLVSRRASNAYIYDEDGTFTQNCNQDLVCLEPLQTEADQMHLKT